MACRPLDKGSTVVFLNCKTFDYHGFTHLVENIKFASLIIMFDIELSITLFIQEWVEEEEHGHVTSLQIGGLLFYQTVLYIWIFDSSHKYSVYYDLK